LSSWCRYMAEPHPTCGSTIVKSFGTAILYGNMYSKLPLVPFPRDFGEHFVLTINFPTCRESANGAIRSLYNTVMSITYFGQLPELPEDILFVILRLLDRRSAVKFASVNTMTLRMFREKHTVEIGPSVGLPITQVPLGRIIDIGKINNFRCDYCEAPVQPRAILSRPEIVHAIRRCKWTPKDQTKSDPLKLIRLLCDQCHRDWERLLKMVTREAWGANVSWKETIFYTTASDKKRWMAIKNLVERKKTLDTFYCFEEKYVKYLLSTYPTLVAPPNRTAPAKRARPTQGDNVEPPSKKRAT
jgi:hypothetical protein